MGVARGRPARDLDGFPSKLIGTSYIYRSGRPTGRPYNEKSCRYAAAFFSMTTNDERIAARRCYGFTTNDERITIGDVMAEPLWINGKSFTAYGLVRRGRSLTSQTAFGGQLPYKGSLGRPVVNNGRYTQLVYEKWFCDL